MLPALNALKRAPYYDTYLNHLSTSDLSTALDLSKTAFNDLLNTLNPSQLDRRYAPEKWTIAEVIQHTIETEMIFNFRALTIAREEQQQTLNGFDENAYQASAFQGDLSLEDWQSYFNNVRSTTEYLARTTSDEQMKKIGVASGHEVQVEALFFISSGHTLHHVKVIKYRYL